MEATAFGNTRAQALLKSLQQQKYTVAIGSRGLIFLKKGDFVKAINDFDKAIVIDSKNSFVFFIVVMPPLGLVNMVKPKQIMK